MKSVPMRTCAITREKYPKSELIRVVRTPEGQVVVDETGKLNGRGVYLKKDVSVVNLAKKKKVLNYHLGTTVEDQIFDDLIKIISE